MLYRVLKLVMQAALRIFFRRLEVQGKGPAPQQGPLLVVSNHPNTFMDPVLVAAALKPEIYFLTKGSLFKTPFRKWFLQRLNMIPIYRREDAAGHAIQNREAFRQCFDFLGRGGSLLIFPEGNSFNERRLRPLKAGAARIALGAEAENDWTLGLRILPVGLNYSEPTRFRSNVLVKIGEPVLVQPYAEAFRENEAAAVQRLTETIRARLEELLIITESEAQDEFVRQVEVLYAQRLLETERLNQAQSFLLTKEILRSIRFFQQHQPGQLEATQNLTDTYFRMLRRLKLPPKPFHQKAGSLASGFKWWLFFVSCFPVYVYGLLNNYLPYSIPARVADAFTDEEEYRAPVMMMVGIFTFPLFYGLQAALLYSVFHSGWWCLLYLLSLPPSGFLVLHYWRNVLRVSGQWRWKRLLKRQNSLAQQLITLRQEIFVQLEKAREIYLLHSAGK